MGKQAKQKKQTKKRNELALLSRQLQRFEEASPNSVSEPTKYLLKDLNPDVKYYEDKSEETTPYPSEWPQKKGLKTAEKKLRVLWIELYSYEDPEEPQSPQASSSGDSRNQHEPQHQVQNTHTDNRNSENDAQSLENKDVDGDINMRSNTDNSENRSDSSGSRENSASANSGTSENRTDSSGSRENSASANSGTSENRTDLSRSRENSASANSGTSENRTESSGSRENSASANSGTSENRTDSSGSRETSASSEPEGNHWPLFTKKIIPQRWIPIKSECRLYGCDFADIGYRCELYCQLEKPEASEDELLDFARTFMLKCPAALATLEEMCEEAAMFSYRRYRSTHPRPLLPSGLNGRYYGRDNRDASVFSDDLDRDRRERGFGRPLKAQSENWQDIVLVRDPDKDEPGEVRGKIELVIGNWVDVSLPSLNDVNPTMERHVLVRKSDYSEKVKQFLGSPGGKNRYFPKGDEGDSLTGLCRGDIKILYYTFARQTYENMWPNGYGVGHVPSDPNHPNVPWTRGLLATKFGRLNINEEVNDERYLVGQEPIVTIPMPRRIRR